MADAFTEDSELLHHPTFSVDDLLRDLEFGIDGPSPVPLIDHNPNIWAANGDMGMSNDFLSYGVADGFNGLHNGSTWTPGFERFGDTGAHGDDLYAPVSPPESESGSDQSWKFDAGFDINRATAEGAHLYAEALSQWNLLNGSGNVYDPFKGSSVIDDLDDQKLFERDRSPLRRSQSANSRPTFADITKKPSSPVGDLPSNLSKDGPVYESEESLSSFYSKKVKPKVFRPAHPRHGGYHVPLPIQPDSKYGLDEFEVPESMRGKMERSFSCNDALDHSQEEAGDDGAESDVSADNNSSRQGWFDPKRIFQNGSSRTRSESEPGSTLLNNSARCQTGAKTNGRRPNTAGYINNLHDDRNHKHTNADRPSKSVNGSANGHTTRAEEDEEGPARSASSLNGMTLSGSIQLGKAVALHLVQYAILFFMMLAGLTAQALYFVVHYTCVFTTITFNYLAVKVGLNSGSPIDDITEKDLPFTFGLDNNIPLPETCEDAMRRLLMCQGKDAYSILGLRSDATDEEIRRYYRRQAVLVHPDKNQQPGSEEAFKVLGQAFELIGSAEKRKIYDTKIHEEKLSEDVRRQFTDLLTKFHEKMEEASNYMHCNNCGDKHRRYPTTKPVYNARKCARCQCSHPAKEGDIWAETTFMGFKWHFYACMENRIYDVTPWVSCQPSMVNKFQPNDHSVRLRMGLSKNGSQAQRPGTNNSRDAGLEHLLKNLFPTPANDSAMNKASGKMAADTKSNRKNKRRAGRRK